MSKRKCSTGKILKDMKSCIKTIYLPVKKELEEDGHATVCSEKSIGIVIMHIQITFFKKHNVLGMHIGFSHGSPEDRITHLYGAINELNSKMSVKMALFLTFNNHPKKGGQ
jgi:hypothetical protein